MATLTVWTFPTPASADAATALLKSPEEQGFVTIHDAATVSWPRERSKPKTRQLRLRAAPALGGAFWGLLFGALFFVPILGMAAGAAVGAAVGALGGALGRVGIHDDLVATVRSKIQPGTSALFLLTSDTRLDKVQGAFAGLQAELTQTNL